MKNNQLSNIENTIDSTELNSMLRGFQNELFRESIERKDLEKLNSLISKNNFNLNNGKEKRNSLLKSLYLRKISEIRYRKSDEISKALKYFYQTCASLDIPLVYVLEKKDSKVTLYLGGFIRGEKVDEKSSIIESFNGALQGLLPGCISKDLEKEEKEDFLRNYEIYEDRRVVFGVPTKIANSRQEQDKANSSSPWGIERIIDAVNSDFSIISYSKPINVNHITQSRTNFATISDAFHLLSKATIQNSENESHSETFSYGTSEGNSETTNYGDSVGFMIARMAKRFVTTVKSSTHSKTQSKNTNKNTSHGNTKGRSSSVSIEQTSSLAKAAESLIKRYDKRFEKGFSMGMWKHTTQVVSNSNDVARRVSNMLAAYWNGEDEALAKIKSVAIPYSLTENNKLPLFDLGESEIDLMGDSVLGKDFSGISTLLTSEEVAMVTGFPNHELPGVIVEKLTDYGRNYPKGNDKKEICLARLVDREQLTKKDVSLNFEQIQRHIFVTGATGSGKSTTMKKLLIDLAKKKIPFLVIEPIKREYRELKKDIPDLNVITLGKNDNKISINPFEIEDNIGLIPHIDNLKSAFNASMGNYSSMPFILEDVIYRAYEKAGWNIERGTHEKAEKLQNAGMSMPLPKMSDLLELVPDAINDFFQQTSDYSNSLFGALKARISSMTRGAKGEVLNKATNSIKMSELLSKPCVIELWPFTDNEEKAFIMALLMIKLYEYRQSIELKDENPEQKKLEHVLVIEEAHRLLSKQQGASEHSASGKQKAVEFFADILAEIRSYGQGIVVVDQIPSKLISDVLKNTDVKIAHRLVHKEDRDIIGATMNLNEDQIKDLARLSPGEAVVYYGGLRQSLKVKVNK